MPHLKFAFLDRKKLALSRDDRADSNLAALLSELTRTANHFEHCVRLFDFASENQVQLYELKETATTESADSRKIFEEFSAKQEIYSSWQFAAAHEAAMAIHDVGTTIEDIDTLVAASRAFLTVLGGNPISAVKALMYKNFAHWVAMRHAVAHKRDIAKNFPANAFKGVIRKGMVHKTGKGGGFLIADGLNGRTLTMTRKGALITLDITQEANTKLGEILANLDAVLKPVQFSFSG